MLFGNNVAHSGCQMHAFSLMDMLFLTELLVESVKTTSI